MYRKLALLISLVLLLGLCAATIVGLDAIDPPAARAVNIGNDGGAASATTTSETANVTGALSTSIDTGGDGVTGSEHLLDMLGGMIDVGPVVDLRTDVRIGYDDATGNVSVGTIDVMGDLHVGATSVETIEDPFEEIFHPGIGRLTMSGGTIGVTGYGSPSHVVYDYTQGPQ